MFSRIASPLARAAALSSNSAAASAGGRAAAVRSFAGFHPSANHVYEKGNNPEDYFGKRLAKLGTKKG
jgi:hypothetical protein